MVEMGACGDRSVRSRRNLSDRVREDSKGTLNTVFRCHRYERESAAPRRRSAGRRARVPLAIEFRVCGAFTAEHRSRLSLTADAALLQLLTCWAPIGTIGASSLYDRMFLTPTLLQQDPGVPTATVVDPVNAGDVLATTINGVAIAPHTVAAGENAATVCRRDRRRDQRDHDARPDVRRTAEPPHPRLERRRRRHD
jgi:hypothetical protein